MSITKSVVATSLLLAVALITNLGYLIQHRRDYGEGRAKTSGPPAFSLLTDWYLRLSTFSIALLSCWADSLWLKGCWVLTSCCVRRNVWQKVRSRRQVRSSRTV